jgi:predicted DNA binding protein
MKETEDTPYQVTFEIVNEGCKGLKKLRESEIEGYILSDIRRGKGNITSHLIRIPSTEVAKVPNTFTKAGNVFRFDSHGCKVCNAIETQKAFLVSGRHLNDSTIIYSFVAPNFTAYKEIVATLEAEGFKPKILEVTKFEAKTKNLTEKQERVLWFALKMGFFNFPRKITMRELSRRLGIALSTTSEISRRGIHF